MSVGQLVGFISEGPLLGRMLTLIFGPCTCIIKQWEPGASAGLSHKQAEQIAGKQNVSQ